MATDCGARTTIAIAGLGSIGRVIAQRLHDDLPRYRLTAASARREDRASEFLTRYGPDAKLVALDELSEHAEMVIECAPAALFPKIAQPVVAAGKDLVPLSVGALVSSWPLVEAAERSGSRILVPTGALAGLDAVQGLAQGTVTSVRIVTRKPAWSLKDAPLVIDNHLDLARIDAATQVFEGSAREAIRGFPANVNVAVALALAGIGPDRTMVEIWAEPALRHNTHRILVDADSGSLDLTVRNVPSENPATGRPTALSVIALLRKMSGSLRIGT